MKPDPPRSPSTSADIGGSRTVATTCVTRPSTKTAARSAPATHPASQLACETSPPTPSALTATSTSPTPDATTPTTTSAYSTYMALTSRTNPDRAQTCRGPAQQMLAHPQKKSLRPQIRTVVRLDFRSRIDLHRKGLPNSYVGIVVKLAARAARIGVGLFGHVLGLGQRSPIFAQSPCTEHRDRLHTEPHPRTVELAEEVVYLVSHTPRLCPDRG
jgi:hypothetical protein